VIFEIWRKCLEQSMYVVGAREEATARLVGIVMLAGNQRHAQLVDATVHPDLRQQGIGEAIGERLKEIAREEKIKYVGLTFDKTKPWLKDAYARHEWVSIDFAMWLRDSVELIQPKPPIQLGSSGKKRDSA
jgi:ribosomal protein S18 acetylase RimI-like enzyme